MNEERRAPRIRVAAVIMEKDSILLVRHEKDGKTYWLLPGGGVEYGESLDKALRREVEEETGLEVETGDLLFAVDSLPPDGERHIVNLCFEAKAIGGKVQVGSDPRVVEAAYVPMERLEATTLYPDIRTELIEAFEKGFTERAPYLGVRWKEA